MPSWKQISGEVGSMSQPAREGLIRTVRFPNQVTISITGRALRKYIHSAIFLYINVIIIIRYVM
jgi:hypothetical protein